MSMTITAKGDRLFKTEDGNEIEIFGAEKLHYLHEMGKIDRGLKVGRKVTNAHRCGCECQICA